MTCCEEGTQQVTVAVGRDTANDSCCGEGTQPVTVAVGKGHN